MLFGFVLFSVFVFSLSKYYDFSTMSKLLKQFTIYMKFKINRIPNLELHNFSGTPNFLPPIVIMMFLHRK